MGAVRRLLLTQTGSRCSFLSLSSENVILHRAGNDAFILSRQTSCDNYLTSSVIYVTLDNRMSADDVRRLRHSNGHLSRFN